MKALGTQLSNSLFVVFIKGYGIKQEKFITDNTISTHPITKPTPQGARTSRRFVPTSELKYLYTIN